MKILVFNWQDIRNPLGGGAEVHLHEIFSRLAQRGHEVTLFCSGFRGAPREETIGGIRILRRGMRSVFNFLVPFAYLLKFRRGDFDVVLDDVNKIPFYTPLYVRRPLVGILHHFFGANIFKEVGLIAGLYVYLCEKLVAPVYRRVPFAVVSPSTQKELEERGFSADRLALVRNSVDHTLYAPATGVRAPFLLVGYVGRLKRYKSIDHLIRAFAAVRREIPEARLIIVGDGDDRARLERIVADLGLSDVVTFTGFVSNEEMVRLLQQMWCVVNPSSKEGWGLTVIEANACGVPCIASDVPGLRDSVLEGKTGMLFPYGDIRQLSEKISLFFRDGELRERFRRNALEWARSFQWDQEADAMMNLLTRVVSREAIASAPPGT